MKSAGFTTPGDIESKIPVVKGKVGHPTVDTLREKKHQYTVKYYYMLLIDKTVRQVSIAKVQMVTPYLKGEVEAQCLLDPIYDLIIGNVEGAKTPDYPDPDWQEACAVTTRAQAKRSKEVKPLDTLETPKGSAILARRSSPKCNNKTQHFRSIELSLI